MNAGPPSGASSLFLPLLLSLTLGLAPFVPKPHLVEKIQMIFHDRAAMRPIDYFDLLLHAAPWIWLLWSLIAYFSARGSAQS